MVCAAVRAEIDRYKLMSDNETEPRIGGNMRESVLIKVDFPEPLGPTTPVNSPGRKESDTSRITGSA